MNYAQYLQQGGQAPSIEEQVVSLVQAAMQGDQQANDQINQIMQAAKQGDQKAQQLAQLIQQVAQKLQGAQPEAMKCGGKVRAKVKKACGGKKLEEGDKIQKTKKGCPCSLKKVGGRLIEVDCNGIPVAKNGAVLYAESGDKMPDMKLPSRSFGDNMRIKWDNFKNGVKDFAYNNAFGEALGWSPMLRHYVYNDPGTSAEEALISLVAPGEAVASKAIGKGAQKAAVQAANAAGKKAVGQTAQKIKYPFGRPESMRRTEAIDGYLENTMNPQARASFEQAMQADPGLKADADLQKEIIMAIRERGLREMLRNEEARIRNIGLRKQGGQLNYSQYMQLGTPKNGIQKLDTTQVDKTTPEKENYSVRKTVVETLPAQGKYIPSLRDSMVYYTRPDGGEYFTEYINGKPYYETDVRNGAGRAINHDLNSSKSDTTYYNWSIPVHWEISQENLKQAYNGSPQPRYQYIGVENIGDR